MSLQIAALYGELARRSPSPVVEVNRAVAVGLAGGPLAGLAFLAPVLASGELDGYGPLHAAHADLLDRAGRADEATAAWARAIEATGNSALRGALERRVAGRDRQERPARSLPNRRGSELRQGRVRPHADHPFVGVCGLACGCCRAGPPRDASSRT